MEDPLVPLERNLYGHSLAGLLWERQFEKILLKHGWEKIPNWECSFVHREKGSFLSVYLNDINLAGKKQNINPMWKNTHERRWFGKTNISPWPCIPGLYSKTMWNKQRHCCQLQKYVWIWDFCRGYRKIVKKPWKPDADTISSWSDDMESHAKKCVERLRTCKQNDPTIILSCNAMHG